ncbi:hypothetical protein F5Y16DRAFT_404106 [Xylariaceae sp. FL0255]|nr:hypothetical protein F5Y16DRAFT_404106 [Xylariaceae sp. FL0255]
MEPEITTPLSFAARREFIEYLEGIAATASLERPKTSKFTSIYLGNFFKAADHDYRRVGDFMHYFDEHAKWDLSKLRADLFQAMVHELVEMLDDLFFFRLLTRPDPVKGGKQPFIHVVAHKQSEYLGHYDALPRRINMCKLTETGERRSFGDVVRGTLHEMTHAFLDQFSNRKDEAYKQLVAPNGNHGPLFWDLHEYTFVKLIEYTDFERFEEILEEIRGIRESYKGDYTGAPGEVPEDDEEKKNEDMGTEHDGGHLEDLDKSAGVVGDKKKDEDNCIDDGKEDKAEHDEKTEMEDEQEVAETVDFLLLDYGENLEQSSS